MFSRDKFSERLRMLRKERRETREELAEAIGTGPSQITEMEHGRKTTTLEKFAAICEHYQVDADYLLGLTDDPEKYRPS